MLPELGPAARHCMGVQGGGSGALQQSSSALVVSRRSTGGGGCVCHDDGGSGGWESKAVLSVLFAKAIAQKCSGSEGAYKCYVAGF